MAEGATKSENAMAEPREAGRGRVASVDLLRGAVMLLMLLDHARTFLHAGRGDPLDPATTTPLLFFTRWITHFCAPTFVLLAGMSVRLGEKAGPEGKREASRRAFRRGLSLVLVELLLVSPVWGRVLPWNGLFLQVVWAIGVSLVVLAGLMLLPAPATGGFGLALILSHNLLPDAALSSALGSLPWAILHGHGLYPVAGRWAIEVYYPLLPWIGVAALGYALGSLYDRGRAERRRSLALAGAASIALFLLLRLSGSYGDPLAYAPGATAIRSLYAFLDVEKYPPSLHFLLITLGPALLSLAALDGARPREAHPFLVFGRTPLFFYVLHLYLLAAASGLLLVATRSSAGFRGLLSGALAGAPFGLGLGAVYLAWLGLAVVLYLACRRRLGRLP